MVLPLLDLKFVTEASKTVPTKSIGKFSIQIVGPEGHVTILL